MMMIHQSIHNNMVQQVRASITKGFNADRNRTNFEKDVDSLLFGDTRPPPRRPRGDPNQKPA